MEKVQFIDIEVIIPNPIKEEMYQTRPENYDSIRENIREFGIIEPLLVNKDTMVIVSGNLRLMIAKELGFTKVPVLFRHVEENEMDIKSLSTDFQRIKTNYELLKVILFFEDYFKVGQGRRTDLDSDAKKIREDRDELFGNVSRDARYKLKKIHEIASEIYGEGTDEYLQVFRSVDTKKTTLNGQYQTLIDRKNRMMNREVIPDNYSIIRENTKIFNKSAEDMSEIADESINAIITSPPYYKMRVYGNENELGQEVTIEDYLETLMVIFSECYKKLRNDGSLFVNINDCVIKEQYQAVPQRFLMKMIQSGWLFNDEMVWLKNNPTYTRGKRAVRSHEYIFHFVKTRDFYYNDTWLKDLHDIDNEVSYGTNNKNPKVISGLDFHGSALRTNVSSTAELRKQCAEKGIYLTHSATFPIDVPAICGFTTTKEGDSILDPFGGTSVSGEFARLNNRKYYSYEVNPQYVKASEARLERIGIVNWNIIRELEKLDIKKFTFTYNKTLKDNRSNFSQIFESAIDILKKYD